MLFITTLPKSCTSATFGIFSQMITAILLTLLDVGRSIYHWYSFKSIMRKQPQYDQHARQHATQKFTIQGGSGVRPGCIHCFQERRIVNIFIPSALSLSSGCQRNLADCRGDCRLDLWPAITCLSKAQQALLRLPTVV